MFKQHQDINKHKTKATFYIQILNKKERIKIVFFKFTRIQYIFVYQNQHDNLFSIKKMSDDSLVKICLMFNMYCITKKKKIKITT